MDPKAEAKSERQRQKTSFPVIDLFAGPGGLGEGFASALCGSDKPVFRSVVSIECDDFSHQTLLLRHFVRQFPDGEFPDEYYDFLAGRISLDELFSLYPGEHGDAQQSALKIRLGPDSHAAVRKIISHRLAGVKSWVLVGGPPCQAYSLVGRSRMGSRPGFYQDERHTLYLEYLRIIADHQPPIFVMENVKGLLSATIDGKSAINRIVADLSQPGRVISGTPGGLSYTLYSLSQDDVTGGEVDPRFFIVRAEEYGIPQARHRMFIVGIRNDLKIRPGILKKSGAPSVRDAIGNLPPIRSVLSHGKDTPENWLSELRNISRADLRRQLNGVPHGSDIADSLDPDSLVRMISPSVSSSASYPAQRSTHPILRSLHDERLPVLTSHSSRGHMPSDLRRYLYAAVFARETGRSPRLVDFPMTLLPDHRNVELGRTGKMFADRFKVQVADHVSSTITSHISKDGHYFIHYDPAQCRSLTVREAARLQTFPDNYYFAGLRTSQYHQVGNAVPPQLARQIAEIVADVLVRIRESE